MEIITGALLITAFVVFLPIITEVFIALAGLAIAALIFIVPVILVMGALIHG